MVKLVNSHLVHQIEDVSEMRITSEINLSFKENNTGWTYLADWKNLVKLTVQDFNESRNYPWKTEQNLMSGNFFDSKWHPTFPQLKSVTIRLVKLPFPYCSLVALLFNSLNLLDLSIHLYNKDSKIQDFDPEDFRKQLEGRQLRLTHLRLLKRHAGIACHPIIPFGSLQGNVSWVCKIGSNYTEKIETSDCFFHC